MIATVVNLDFEYELANGRHRRRSTVVKTSRIWKHLLRLLPEGRRAETLDPFDPLPKMGKKIDTLIPWGVTETTWALARELGLQPDWPDPATVKRVNSKLYSHRLEAELGISLPGSREVTTPAAFEEAVGECQHDWVLKHPFGVSGRERMLGRRGTVSPSALGWARKRLGDHAMVFEPWVEQRRDYSFHFLLQPGQPPRSLGHCLLLTDPGGTFRGNEVRPRQPPPPALAQPALKVALAVSDQGYWGPLSIDALQGSLGEETVSRPLVEINARYTFGRMTLELARFLPAGWSYRWWHSPQPDLWQGDIGTLGEAFAQRAGLFRLPLHADPEGASGSLVLAAPDEEGLERLLSAFER